MFIYVKISKKSIQKYSTDVLLRSLIFCALVRQERDKGHKGARGEQVQILKELAKRYGLFLNNDKISTIIDLGS